MGGWKHRVKDRWAQSKSVDALTDGMLRINKTGLEPVKNAKYIKTKGPNIQNRKDENDQKAEFIKYSLLSNCLLFYLSVSLKVRLPNYYSSILS